MVPHGALRNACNLHGRPTVLIAQLLRDDAERVWHGGAAGLGPCMRSPPPSPPPGFRRDTSLRVDKPKHDKGSENAAHVRVLEAGRHENVGGLCTHGVVLKRYAPHTVQQ